MAKKYYKKVVSAGLKKRIIIFSSVESLGLAQAIQSSLHTSKYSIEVWANGFFKLSQSYISNFRDLKHNYDFAVVICSNDDLARVRGRAEYKTRDNVILELGMCISTFTMKRVIIVKHEAVKLPSDLDGINPIDYSIGQGESLHAVAGTICAKIDDHISSSSLVSNKLSWDEYFFCMKQLSDKLGQSLGMNGYNYDVVVGINRGGVMAADLLSREKGHDIPVVALYAERKARETKFASKSLLVDNEVVINVLKSDRINNILLVDSFTRDGKTIIAAKKYLQERLPQNKTIKAAVIYVNKRLEAKTDVTKQIDYIGEFKDLDGKKLSLEPD